MNKKVIEIERVNYEVNKDARAYVEACESTFKTKIESIADYIYENKNTINVILLSGPSSSGKTTTSSILIDRLEDSIELILDIRIDKLKPFKRFMTHLMMII